MWGEDGWRLYRFIIGSREDRFGLRVLYSQIFEIEAGLSGGDVGLLSQSLHLNDTKSVPSGNSQLYSPAGTWWTSPDLGSPSRARWG
ncbi:uncharacterized protein RSE6_15007 [Rhynchosporium secalis]|uniref:Uncharacterized protein n=1 Tax=Rhynchosporium secalis TaxID=38038 RepID=A0A1E1MWJ6_RHYSE|nr:uncharacterized protein RSE6_15007 [Rhynchosporium secalis]